MMFHLTDEVGLGKYVDLEDKDDNSYKQE